MNRNPYIVGYAVDRPDMFFGREDILERIKAFLSTNDRPGIILLLGSAKAGKSSILQQLTKPEVLPGWLTVNCCFQEGRGVGNESALPTSEALRLITRQIGWKTYEAGIPTWPGGGDGPWLDFRRQFARMLEGLYGSGCPFDVFKGYVREVLEKCRPRRLLILLDEVGKVTQGFQTGVADPQILAKIVKLTCEYPELSVLIAGAPSSPWEHWLDVASVRERLHCGALNVADARELVTAPVASMLNFSASACNRILDLTARRPFLIQALCSYLFEQVVEDDRTTVNDQMVEASASEFVRDNEHFSTIWAYVATDGRRQILAYFARVESCEIVSLLEGNVDEHLSKFSSQQLKEDVDFLCELGLLDLTRSANMSTYRLAVPLMGLWIRQTIEFDNFRQKALKEGKVKNK